MGMVIPIAIALVTVPIYISYIGVARYGVLSIIWLVLGYFGFLDFGLSRAAANALAKIANASKEERAGVLMTSLYLNLLLGAIGGILLYFAGGLILRHLATMSDVMIAEVEKAFPWIACMLPLALLAGVGRGAMQARERFFDLNVLDLISFTLGQVLPLLCIMTIGPSLVVVIPAAFFARALSVGLSLGWVARIESVRTFLIFDRSRSRELLGFGVWVTITNVIGPLLTSIDQLLMGSMLGATAVAYYAVPMNLVSRSQLLSLSLTAVLFPRFSQQQPEEAMLLARKAVLSLGYGFGAICGPAIILGGAFLTLWIGADFASHATLVLELLLIGAWFNGIAFIPYAFLQGQGRPDLVAKLHALELVPYVAVLWFLLHRFGLPGAALAWGARVVADAALLFRLSRFPVYYLLRLAPALILILASYFATQIAGVSMFWCGLLAGLIFLAFAGCAVVFDATTLQIILALRARLMESVGSPGFIQGRNVRCDPGENIHQPSDSVGDVLPSEQRAVGHRRSTLVRGTKVLKYQKFSRSN
jgi:O-antigen/teichoic acid export membrane protein